MLDAALETAGDVFFRDVVAALQHAKFHALHRLRGRADYDVMQDEAVALRLGGAEEGEVAASAQGGLDGGTGAGGDEVSRFFKEDAPRFEGGQGRIQRGEAAGDFIGIEKPHQSHAREQLAGEGGFPGSIAAADDAEGGHGLRLIWWKRAGNVGISPFYP